MNKVFDALARYRRYCKDFFCQVVGFSDDGNTIVIGLEKDGTNLKLSVSNPGPSLPERMRHQMFDSMVSMRPTDDNKHLGLGLYVARLIAVGHGGRIDAENTGDGVKIVVSIPGENDGE